MSKCVGKNIFLPFSLFYVHTHTHAGVRAACIHAYNHMETHKFLSEFWKENCKKERRNIKQISRQKKNHLSTPEKRKKNRKQKEKGKEKKRETTEVKDKK